MIRLPDSFFGVVFVALGIVAVTVGAGMEGLVGPGIGPGLMPMLTGAGFILFGAVLTIQGLPELKAMRAGLLPLFEPRPNPWFPLIVLSALVVYVLLLPVAGFVPLTLVFVALVVRASGGGILASFVFAAAVTAILYLFFAQLFRVPLPPGIIGTLAFMG